MHGCEKQALKPASLSCQHRGPSSDLRGFTATPAWEALGSWSRAEEQHRVAEGGSFLWGSHQGSHKQHQEWGSWKTKAGAWFPVLWPQGLLRMTSGKERGREETSALPEIQIPIQHRLALIRDKLSCQTLRPQQRSPPWRHGGLAAAWQGLDGHRTCIAGLHTQPW